MWWASVHVTGQKNLLWAALTQQLAHCGQVGAHSQPAWGSAPCTEGPRATRTQLPQGGPLADTRDTPGAPSSGDQRGCTTTPAGQLLFRPPNQDWDREHIHPIHRNKYREAAEVGRRNNNTCLKETAGEIPRKGATWNGDTRTTRFRVHSNGCQDARGS